MENSKLIIPRKKIPFSLEEAKILSNIVNQEYIRYGKDPNWCEIAKKMPNNRNARECRERWVFYISAVKKPKKWTRKEDELLLFLQKKHGNKWTFFSKNYFKDISPTTIKNHFINIEKMSSYIKHSTKDRIGYIINNQEIDLTEFQEEINQRIILDDELIDRIIDLTDSHMRAEGINTIVKRPVHEASFEERKIICDLREKYQMEFKTIDRILFNVDGESMKFYNEYISSKLAEAFAEQNSNSIEYQNF